MARSCYLLGSVPDTEYQLFLVGPEDKRVGKTMLDPGWCCRTAEPATMTEVRRTVKVHVPTIREPESVTVCVDVSLVDLCYKVPAIEAEVADEKSKKKEKAQELTRPAFAEAIAVMTPSKHPKKNDDDDDGFGVYQPAGGGMSLKDCRV